MMSHLLLLPWAASLLVLAVMAWGTWITLRRHRNRKNCSEDALMPVSILKPLKGVDPGLEENLRSFFELVYPEFEIIFSVACKSDPARTIVEKLMAQFPSVRARLVMGEIEVGHNPKINNLIKAYQVARHDWILISDSNVKVAPYYLWRKAAHWEQDTGVITAVVRGTNSSGWGAQMEALFLNTYYARGMNLADFFGKGCVMGKSMLFRRSDADRFGGLTALARFLAEDQMTGEAMRMLGKKVVLMTGSVTQNIGNHSLKDFWSRHLRWGRIRKAQEPLFFPFELLLSSVFSGLLGALSASLYWEMSVSTWFVAHMMVWGLLDWIQIRTLSPEECRWNTFGVWCARELSAMPLFFVTCFSNRVTWRGRVLRIETGGVVRFA